jgi:ribosome-associated heat shock protein Hsp15
MTEHSIDASKEQRIDKWLHFSCLFKTRSKATKACEERRVKVNGKTTKPSKVIRPGDELTIRYPNGKYVNYDVLDICHRNIPKSKARTLYNVQEPEVSEKAKELYKLFNKSIQTPKRKYKGRPTKRERRQMEKVKGKIG